MKRSYSLLTAAGALGLILGLSLGCGSSADAPREGEAGKAGSTAAIRLALVPSEDAERMTEGFEPIRAQLEKDLGRKVEMVSVTDYSSVIEAMRAKKVDVAWFGPLSTVLAKQQAGAEPFAIAEVEGKGLTYRSLIVTRSDSGATKLEDLSGKTLALVDPASTSGNLVPRSELLVRTQKKAEDFFSKVTYAGSHDASLMALVNRSVDVCAVQDITFEAAVEKGTIRREDYVIILESEPIPQSPMAYRDDLDADLKKKISDSFTNLDKAGIKMDVPGMGNVLKFVPTSYEQYLPVEKMAKTLGLTPEQMAK